MRIHLEQLPDFGPLPLAHKNVFRYVHTRQVGLHACPWC